MMGLGSFGSGGSSSSSNLSALAPPFTVDRSVPKPNSNPLMNFNELPYPAPFNSSIHNPHSPSSLPNYFSNPNSEVDLMPSPNVHRYLVSQSLNSPNTHMPPLNPVATNATDAYSFGQYSDSGKTSLVEAKPYYPSYVSPAIRDDIPLVGLNESGYDLLSTSRVGPLNESSQNDYTQSLAGLEYTSPWGGFWNGLADLESGRRTDFDGSFCSKERNVTSSSIYRDYPNQGTVASKGLSRSEETSAVSHSSNVLGRENCIGFFSTKQLDAKSSVPQNFKFSSNESTRTPIGGSSPRPLETHPLAPFVEPITNSWNCQKPYNASYEKCFRQHDRSLSDCNSLTKSSPALVIRPPAVTASSSVSNTVSFINVNSIGCNAAGKSEDFAHRNSSSVKEPRLSLASEGKEVRFDTRVGIHLERNDRNIVDTSSTKKEELSSNKTVTKDALDNLFKARSEPQVPHISSADGFSWALNDAEACNSVENSSKSLDQYNPAVDSPCWKGATASRLSPFEISEAVTPENLLKKLEVCNGWSLEGPQIFPLNTDDAVRVFSQKLSENIEYGEDMFVENGPSPSAKRASVASYSFNGCGSDDSLKAGSCSTKWTCGYGVQCSDDIHELSKEDTLPNHSKNDADCEVSNTTQPSLEEIRFISERKHTLGTCGAGSGMNVNDASEDGLSHVPFRATKQVLFSPSSEEDAPNKLAKLSGGESAPKIDVQMLVKMMHSLSDLLLFHCSNDECALNEQDHESLKHVINNLNACILKDAEQMTPNFPQQGNSQSQSELSDLHKGATLDRPQVTQVAVANVMGQVDHQHIIEEKRHNIMLGTKDVKFQDFVRDDADIVKNDDMTEAIKKVLIENFHGEEETLPEVLLYKNLWLEAEAVICSLNYKARFDRMRIEMEKCKSHEAKDLSENSMDVEKLSRSKVFTDRTMIHSVAPETKGGIQDSPIMGSTSHADDVITRFNMLKCRVDNSNSMDIRTAEKVSSSQVSPDQSKVDKLEPQPKDSSTPDISVQDSPTANKTSHSGDIEDSIMARFRILKCRVDNSCFMDMDGQQLAEAVDLGFVGKRNHSLIIRDGSWDGSLDGTIGRDLQHHTADCTEDKLTVRESHRCINDDAVIQSCRTDRLGNQLPAGWYDSSSSDWEHVLKDELAWQN